MSTMSARVLSPAVLSELRRLRVPKGGGGRAAAVAGVRRNLFGSPGAAARALAELELNRATDEGCRRWEFDFRSDRPLPGSGRFDWRPIGRRPAALPAIADPTPMEIETQPIQKVEEKTKPVTPKIQTRITDFMKPRKRSATGGAAPPAKVARPSPAAAPAAEQRPTS